jgi:hypothetical protein
MDVVIGRIPPPGSTGDRSPEAQPQVEARVLHIRQARKKTDVDKGNRKSAAPSTDPPGARVLVLMIPDAHRLPEDLNTGAWRVFLRFARK